MNRFQDDLITDRLLKETPDKVVLKLQYLVNEANRLRYVARQW